MTPKLPLPLGDPCRVDNGQTGLSCIYGCGRTCWTKQPISRHSVCLQRGQPFTERRGYLHVTYLHIRRRVLHLSTRWHAIEIKSVSTITINNTTNLFLTAISISKRNSFRLLFDKIVSVYFSGQIYLYFSIGNGQLS